MISKLLAASICVFGAAAQNSTTPQYDYVIAGAGTAGLLLASILSEDPNISVLVLEAGTDSRTEVNVTDPERRGTIQHTQFDWGFESTLQPGLYDNGTGGSQYVPRGKTMGGTSAMNWM
jgi:choline dehydrogenase